MLKSFEIRGFRTFQELKIESLGQVNLIVGKNNVGKTTLLEALRLYGSGDIVGEIARLLRDRGEALAHRDSNSRQLQLSSLFHGRASDSAILIQSSEYLLSITRSEVFSRDQFSREEALEVEMVGQSGIFSVTQLAKRKSPDGHASACTFIPAAGIPHSDAVHWWDDISRSLKSELRVIEFLKFVAPVDRIQVIGDDRAFWIRPVDSSHAVPLKSYGHGVTRMLQVAIAVERVCQYDPPNRDPFVETESEDPRDVRLLLIDEFENGIYHGVLPDLWRFVFRLAKLNNLQVFVTTHSADCVDAFLKVSLEDEAIGKLIRLEGRDERRRSVIMKEEDFPAIRDSNIEVR